MADYFVYTQVEVQLAEEGVQEAQNGYTNHNPHINLQQACLSLINRSKNGGSR